METRTAGIIGVVASSIGARPAISANNSVMRTPCSGMYHDEASVPKSVVFRVRSSKTDILKHNFYTEETFFTPGILGNSKKFASIHNLTSSARCFQTFL